MAHEQVENGSSRGEFLARSAGLAGLTVGAGVWAAGRAPRAQAAGDVRSYVSGAFQLNLEGTKMGFLKSVDGGAISAEVVQEKAVDNISKKHLAGVKYEDFTVKFGFGMHKNLYAWMSETAAGKGSRQSGDIQTADASFVAKSRRTFTDALITEIGFPALDAGSKETGYMRLEFAPESIKIEKDSGKLSSTVSKPKKWLVSNFRFELDGLPTTRVSKIDAFTIKQTIVTDSIGETRIPVREPGKLEFPNLTVMFAERDVGKWDAWFEDFVINGNNGEDMEKSGRIFFLDPVLKPLGSIELHNVGIFRLVPDGTAANSDKLKRVIADLYCERMTLKLG